MVLAGIPASKQSPDSASLKFKHRKVLAVKSKMLKKKMSHIKCETKNPKVENMNKQRTRDEAKENTTTDVISYEVKTSALERAQEVQAKLPPQFPSFVKSMLKSHVTGGFWLGLPKPFCDRHLPKHDETVILVGEDEREYSTKYLVNKNGLSGGWRGFSLVHKLLDGDVLVFQLIHACKFKVYIVRANGLTEIDGAISLLNLDIAAKPIDMMKMEVRKEENERNNGTAILHDLEKPFAIDTHQAKNTMIVLSDSDADGDRSGNESNEFGSDTMEITDGIRLSEASLEFKDVKSFYDFKIQVNGLILNSEIPQHLQTKYYELCCSQKKFIHDHLIEGLNSKLAAGMISETINIADAIRATKISTSLNHLESWDKTLKAFEDLGMEVGFLRSRLHKLVSLSRESQAVIESKKQERAKAEEDFRDLEVKLLEIKRLMKRLEHEIEALKRNNEKLATTFKELASAPW